MRRVIRPYTRPVLVLQLPIGNRFTTAIVSQHTPANVTISRCASAILYGRNWRAAGSSCCRILLGIFIDRPFCAKGTFVDDLPGR